MIEIIYRRERLKVNYCLIICLLKRLLVILCNLVEISDAKVKKEII